MRTLVFLFLIMSVQQLLPKEVLAKSLSICFNPSKLPARFVTKDGPVKERNVSLIKGSFLTKHFSDPLKTAEDYFSKKLKSLDKTAIDANHQTWKLLARVLSDEFLVDKFYDNDYTSADINAANDLTNCRVGKWVTLDAKTSLNSRYKEGLVNYYKFIRLANHLEETRDKYNKAFSMDLARWKRDGMSSRVFLEDCFGLNRRIKIYQVNDIVLTRVSDKHGSYKNYFFTNVHLARVIDYIKSCAVFSLYAVDIEGMPTNMKGLIKLFKLQCSIGLKTPNGVGGVFKSARQILFLGGDRSNTFGSSPVNLYVGGLSGDKEKYAEKVAYDLESITGDRKSAINVANIFRMIPHPDQDMKDVFETVEGFKDCNPVDDKGLSRFEGIARKTIYESLTSQRIQVRAEAIDQGDQIAVSFCRSINATSTPTSALLSAGFTKWSKIRFLSSVRLFDSDKQEIPTSNKSSAPNAALSEKMIGKISDDISLKDYRDIRSRLISVNDIASKLKGKDELDFKQARKRFREVMKSHAEFERKYLEKGLTIDDIPSDDLSKFVRSDPSNAYTVCTEPKIGEVHKDLTRMFYMAEQALKVMTQVCERFTKKIVSKSSGISIVKNYRARRKELEGMLHAYTGVIVGESDNVIYISFDMSEFSKKFPQKIIRILGKILSELSGEDWMNRIDLFFRAAVVYHNTRGFIGVKSGVTGGFEGFLNFLWTLAMKIVMDIATQATGVTGVLAVYSDDGLLRLYVDGDSAEVKAKILTIQKVFKSYGLIFHMDKTLASPELLEYLGVYADRGAIIPTWVKEAMSIGKRKRTKGLETVYDRISLVDSQCNAVVKAGGPPYTSSLVKSIIVMSILRRLNREASSQALSMMLTIPFSCGGFRVSSITETSLLSSIDPLTEFCADMELLYEYKPVYATAIIDRVLDSLKSPKDAERTLITSSLLQTDLIDTSGNGIVRSLIEAANIDLNVKPDPIDEKAKDIILSELRSSKNIPIRPIRTLIQSIPDVVEYNKAIAIIKSDVALRFLEQSRILKAQRNDTRVCTKSISEWVDHISNFRDLGNSFKSNNFCNHIIHKLYPDYDIAILTDSPRTALEVTDNNDGIITSFEINTSSGLLYQDYKEPEAKFLGAQLSPEYSAEGSASVKQRQYDRFIANAARIIATNRSLLSLYYIVANAFNLPCPAPPAASVSSAHRSTRNFGKNAVTAILPIPFHALINSKMSNYMWNRLSDKERCDRTTMVEAAKIGTYLNIVDTIPSGMVHKPRVRVIGYTLRDIEVNTSNPVFLSSAFPKFRLITNEATQSFTSVIVEENAQANALEGSIHTNGLIETIKDTPIVKAILLANFESWLYNSINNEYKMSTLPPNIPDPWKVMIYSEATVAVSFRSCKPNSRRMIQTAMADFITATSQLDTDRIIREPEKMALFDKALNSKKDAFDELLSNISNVFEALLAIDVDNRIRERLGTMDYSSNVVVKSIIRFLKRRSVTGGTSAPTVVINTDTFADVKLSKKVKTIIKDTIDITISKYFNDTTKEEKWTRTEVLDAHINLLTIMKNMLRPSGHRNTPFNKHMVAIQLIKFEIFVTEMIGLNRGSVTVDDLNSYRIDRELAVAIANSNAVIRGDSGLTTGSDMRTCLFAEGIPTWSISRINYILKHLSANYSGGDIRRGEILHNRHFMQDLLNYILDTYNIVIGRSVKNIVIRHRREAEKIGEAATLSPVEEASIIGAEIDESDLVAIEEDTAKMIKDEKYARLIRNLIIAHYTRWRVDGYKSVGYLNHIIRDSGASGNCSMTIRSKTESSFVGTEHTSDYTLSISSYFDEESCIHNYLYVNTRDGGMAVMASDGIRYLLFSIIPKGTVTVNTYTASEPVYLEGVDRTPTIYTIGDVTNRLAMLSETATIQRGSASGTKTSLIVQQSYQRIIGCQGNVVEKDEFLVSMAELVRGSWSVEIGVKVLSMFCSWYTMTTEPNQRDYRRAARLIEGMAISDDPSVSMKVQSSCSAVWTWLTHMNIHAGLGIDTGKVDRITSIMGRAQGSGGYPVAFYNMPPKQLDEVITGRGLKSIEEVIGDILPLLFRPHRLVMPYLTNDDESDYDSDEW